MLDDELTQLNQYYHMDGADSQQTSKYKLIPLIEKQELWEKCMELLNQEWPKSPTQRRISLEKSLNSKPPMSLAMIDVQTNYLIGHGRLCLLPSDPTGCWVESVIVCKSHRNLGLGRLIMEFLEEEAKKHNFTKICLSTEDKEGFYTKCGYQVSFTPIINFGANSKLFAKISQRVFFGDKETTISKQKEILCAKPRKNELISAILPPPLPPPPQALKTENAIAKQKIYMYKCLQ